MDRDHSRLIIILLGGILFVLLVGRATAIEFLGTASWVGLVIGAVALIVWVIVTFIRFTRREATLYREEISRDRREGRPWLHTFVAWPGIIGNFVVFGFAVSHISISLSRKSVRSPI